MRKVINFAEACGLTILVPFLKLAAGDDRQEQLQAIAKLVLFPAIALLLFFGTWGLLAKEIRTSVGQLPSPRFVWKQAAAMWATYRAERVNKEQFERYETHRSALHSMVQDRAALGETNPEPVAAAALAAKQQAYVTGVRSEVEQLRSEASELAKLVDEAEAQKDTRYNALKRRLSNAKAFAYDENGKVLLDVDGKPQLEQSAVESLAAIENERVLVYESALLQIYANAAKSLDSLLNKVEKIDKANAALLKMSAAGVDLATDKKAASQAKKKAAFEKQIGKSKAYSGNGSIIDYITLSIITVLFGFFLAAGIAIPVGIICGLSQPIMAALNPLIQVFRPVSPLAWVLITIQIVDGIFVGDNALEGDIVKNTFLHAGITVALCSMWATLSNTALGVSSVDRDHLNVARVLKLGWFDRVFKIIIPSAIPYIFTGLRITLGVGWMVLIVSEMMATSRGLGWFIDQEYQNNKVESLANIIVCIFIIGIIGAMLDRIMFTFQRLVSFEDEVTA